MESERKTSMLKDKTVRTSIITGLISSAIFLVFFQSIFEFLSKQFLKLTSTILGKLVDDVYLQAAVFAYNDSYGSSMYSLFSGILVGIMMNFLIGYFLMVKGLNKDSDTLIKRKDVFLKVGFCYIALFIIYMAYQEIHLISVRGSYVSYMQRITAITPYTTGDQIKKINSKWVMMKTKNDYVEVNKVIDDIAKANNLDIPKPF